MQDDMQDQMQDNRLAGEEELELKGFSRVTAAINRRNKVAIDSWKLRLRCRSDYSINEKYIYPSSEKNFFETVSSSPHFFCDQFVRLERNIYKNTNF